MSLFVNGIKNSRGDRSESYPSTCPSDYPLAAATHYGFTVDDLKERKGLKEFFGFKEKGDQMTIDTTNMCSHLQKKLFEEDGIYHPLWLAMQDDAELTAVVRSRQLHIYRNGKKILVLAGKAAPKIIREDKLCEMLQQ